MSDKKKKKISPFARDVYRAVAQIPLGEVRTYKWVASRISRPKAYRAVGQALKHNPYPLLLPCHRVVASNEKLGGYVFGVAMKKRLLEREREIKRCLQKKR